MAEKTEVAVAAGRSHIIKRPRLTRLLDESTSRIILLVAPAGYGKTTLARQWLENRRHAWYRGTPASADVAALARALATEMSTILPGVGERMEQRLHLTAEPERDVSVFAELLADDLADWPADAWLVFDDYHFAAESDVAELFIDLLLSKASLSAFITARQRPRWATARRILYGDFFELGRSELAMSGAETSVVLSARGGPISGLQDLAEGWPAVIGLAALAEDRAFPNTELPRSLYEFFAEELLEDVEETTRTHLCQLAVSPTISKELLRVVCGASADQVVREASRVGILAHDPTGNVELHPLLHEFLRARSEQLPTTSLSTAVSAISHWLINTGQWDDAFAVASRFSREELVIPLIEAALPELLSQGRLPTLRRWIDAAQAARLSSPLLEVADAELRFRAGRFGEAEQIALHAAGHCDNRPDIKFQALHLAGASAYQRDQFDRGFEFHRQALEHAHTQPELRKSTWGQFLSAIQLEMLDEALGLIDDLRALSDGSADATIQLTAANLLIASKSSGFDAELLSEARGVLGLFPSASDPKISSSLIHLVANALALGAYYTEALDVVNRALQDVRRYRLDFVLPFSYLLAANAYFGLRRFREASGFLDECESAASAAGDRYILMTARGLRARMLVSLGLSHEALAVTSEEFPAIPSRAIYGEYLGSRALALACNGKSADALETATRAATMTGAIEARAIAAAAQAVAALERPGPPSGAMIRQGFRMAIELGAVDPFVAAFRARPALVEIVAGDSRLEVFAREILSRSNDVDLARQAGFALPSSTRAPGNNALTPREREVHQLLAEGLSNREIARALFISEPTAKVHVRRVLQKLGVRSRTQAALRFVPTDPD